MTVGETRLEGYEPLPVPEEPPPRRRLPPKRWAAENLFNTWYNAVLTVAFGGLLIWAGFRALRFVFVSARWEIVERNLTLFMLGRYPREEIYRVWVAVFVVALMAGLANGVISRGRQRVDVRRGLRRAAPALVLLAVMLVFTRTIVPLLLVLLAVVAAAAARPLGRRLPERTRRWLPALWLITVVLAFAAFTAWGGVGWDRWGGLLLTLFLAVGGIVLSFPFGVLLALGRRSSFPLVRAVCVGYIELIRGVPLITLLFMGAFALGFFLPRTLRPSLVTASLVALVLFTAAYVAEIVRGGLQGVPKGQTEAAQALGLSPIKTTALIVLPQGLRNVIPALVGQFISLFKDTSLVTIIGLLELLQAAQIVTAQGDFVGQGLHAETLTFAAFIYWAFCYTMSRESQRLERRLGVGER